MQVKLPKQTKLIGFLLFILCFLALKVWFLNKSFRSVVEQNNLVVHTNEVMNQLEMILSSAKDAESGVRGFLLTKDAAHLDTYQQGVTNAKNLLNQLKILISDNQEQLDAAQVTEDILTRRFKILEEILKSYNLKQDLKLVDRLKNSRVLSDNLRKQINNMKASEKKLLVTRDADLASLQYLFKWVLFLSNVFLSAILIYIFLHVIKSQNKLALDAKLKELENYTKTLIAQLASKLAGDLSLEQASNLILNFFTSEFKALAAKMYYYENNKLVEVSSTGVPLNKNFEASAFAYSIFQKNEITKISDIPQDFWTIDTALGRKKPDILLYLPISHLNKKIGLIELAGFNSCFYKNSIEVNMGSFAEAIGSGVSSSIVKDRLTELLLKTQEQTEELQAQQEELRSSNEELEQQAQELEIQQQILNTKNNDLERIHVQLEKHAAELEQINQYKSEFLAKMSHELRTPLNGLLILSALLSENKENNLTEQQRQFAKSINNAGHDLLLLINDILDLSKIEAQKLTLRPEFFSLQDIFESIENTFKHQAESKSLNLILDLPENIKNLKINTDRQRLEQIIRNFISNAIKFTEKGSITVKAMLNDSTQDVVFSVKDTGIGIPENKQKLIFEAFEQADGSVSRKYGGTGLGLTISRELSALLGGFVDLESKENYGSTFFLTIPQSLNTADEVTDRDQKTKSTRDLAEIFDKNLSSEKIQPAKSSQTITNYESEVEEILSRIPNNSRSILIVEDDADFRLSIVETVKNYDFFPIEVADGELALAILKKHIPTAILLDIKLPGISGLGILDNIKKIPQLRHIPVHMISGLEYQQNALRMGALGYLTKPVTLDKINAALKRIELLLSNSVKRILLIEDDEKQRFAISSLISGSDVEVVAATNGKVALEKIKTEGFDCIILDLTLPDMTGFDLLAQLNSISISLPPVVIYTGQDLTDEEDKYLRQFSESIIIKGARSPERLLDEVNLFLHRIESLLPESTKEILYNLRSQEKSFEGKTVLVVDDDIRNIFALTSALEAKGLNVKVARDGLEALEVLEKNPAIINLILMDIMMPKMNGYDAIKSIRSNENVKISSLPIIALTAKAMKEDHEKCINAGANDYLPKPINIDNLVTILRIWLAPKGLFS